MRPLLVSLPFPSVCFAELGEVFFHTGRIRNWITFKKGLPVSGTAEIQLEVAKMESIAV